MKKVVLFSAFVSPLRSGAEACAEEVAARLQRRYDIVIIAARMRKDLPIDGTLSTGVRVKRVGFGMTFDKWLYPVLAPMAAIPMKPDIVHAVLESFAGLALVFAGTVLFHAKRMLTCQSTNTTSFLRAMHKSADAVTCISSVLVQRANRMGYEATLIPNGIRSKELLEASMERVPGRILFVGRLEPMKGVDDLIEAYGEVRSKHPHATLRIVGDGSERARLEKLAKGIPGITFAGKVAHDRVVDEYASAEIFCGLSRSEAFGNVFLEAQAAGCAVVATNVQGIPDIVHDGVTGMLVPPKNPSAAADVLIRLLEDSDLRRTLGEGGRANAANYDWNGISEKYAAVYEELTK